MPETGYQECDMATSDSLDALAELERNSSQSVCQIRTYQRITLKTKIIAQPGNVSQRRELKVQGVSGDISTGGCKVLFPIPLNVGDIYRLTFDRDVLDVSPAFARCLRCKMLREDAFECGFSFFTPLEIQISEQEETDDLFG